MTSIAFIMGVVPLVFSTGAGAEIRSAMGVAVFFGHGRRHRLRAVPDAGVLHRHRPVRGAAGGCHEHRERYAAVAEAGGH